MFAPFKALLSRRIFALVIAVLMAVTAGFFIITFTVCKTTAVTSIAPSQEVNALQPEDFTTCATLLKNNRVYSSDKDIAERVSHISDAVTAASKSEYALLTDKRTLVLGYCKDLEPVHDKIMHRLNSDTIPSDDPMIRYLVLYNLTYPNDMGLYEAVCSKFSVQTDGGYTLREVRISFKKSLYRSGFQCASSIPNEVIFCDNDIVSKQGDRLVLFGAFRAIKRSPGKEIGFSFGAPFANSSLFPDYPGYISVVKVPDGLTTEEYLETDEGNEKLGDTVEMFEKNAHSVPVVLTDSLMSIYKFNTGKTPIIEGRAFNSEEYASGAQVCVISTALANENNLTVGDTIDIQFYNRGKLNTEGIKLPSEIDFYAPYFRGITPITDSMKYKIVGIYESDKFLFGEHDFTPNTVFIPSASMTDEAVRENLNADWEPMSTKLISVIIENGKLYEFREEMESLGYGDCFLYSDENGMTDVFLAAVELENHIRPIFIASAVIFAAVALICTVLAGVIIKRTDEYKEILAQSRAKAYFAAALSTFTFSACALLLGVIASYFLFDTVAALLIGANTGVDFSFVSALKALGLEAAVTAVGSAIGGIGGKGRRKVTGEAPAKSIK